MLKKYALIIVVAIMALALAVPAFASEEHDCAHEGTSIESLHHCVEHAVEMGHISKPGIAEALIAKLEAAHSADERGNTNAALNALNAFINQLNAQSGKGVDAEHAGHLIDHTLNVISTLSG